MSNTLLRRRGLGQLDVLVSVLIVLAAFTFLAACMGKQKELDNRVKCATNLRQIGQGLKLYINDYKVYPRTRYSPGEDLNYYTSTGNGTQPNDVTGAIFLLVKHMTLKYDVFLCPSAQAVKKSSMPRPDPGWNITTMHNFPGPSDLDYALSNMYPTPDAIKRGYKWHDGVPAEWAIGGDMGGANSSSLGLMGNASPEEIRKGNSPNHRSDGQNVLYNDGRVAWRPTPFCGSGSDNIYTRAKAENTSGEWRGVRPPASEPGVDPAWGMDTVLVPTAR